MCELDTCPGGPESILVGDEAAASAATRMLLLRPHPQGEGVVSGQRRRDPYQMMEHGEQLQRHAVHGKNGGFLRGPEPPPQSEDEDEVPGRMRLQRRGSARWRRRLTDITDVEFLVPLEGGVEGLLTGSQQAAAFVNNMADMVRTNAFGWHAFLSVRLQWSVVLRVVGGYGVGAVRRMNSLIIIICCFSTPAGLLAFRLVV